MSLVAAYGHELVAALGCDPGGSTVEPLAHGMWSESVERVSGAGWSLIRKRIPSGGASHAEREVRALTSEVLGPFRAAGLTPPQVHGVHRDERGTTLWLADAGRAHVADVEALVDVASRFGRAQGRYLRDGVPGDPWLCDGFLRSYGADRSDADVVARALDDDRLWEAAEQIAPLRSRLAELWRDRFEFADALGAVPATLVHNDLWSANLVRVEDGIVLIDWGFLGPGPVGSDIANLVLEPVLDGFVPASDLHRLDREAYDAYRAGLSEVGADMPDDTIRLGYTAAGALRFSWLGPLTVLRATTGPTWVYGRRVMPTDQWLALRAHGLSLVLDWAGEARSLLGARSLAA